MADEQPRSGDHDPGDRSDETGADGAHEAESEPSGALEPGTDDVPDAGSDDGDHAAPEAPEDDRESAYALLQRGRALNTARHHAQAAVVLERAAGKAPGKGSILEALGRAYYNSGQHDRARETFESLLEVDPSAHYAHYALGQSYKQLGRRREARTHLRLAVALHPTSGVYRGALDRLGPPEPPASADRSAAEPAQEGAVGPGDGVQTTDDDEPEPPGHDHAGRER